MLAGLVGKQRKKETDAEYQARIDAEANRLIKRVVAIGEFYLVRAGNTRKGTGTFYTRPQLAVPTVHRTLEPLCYDKADDGTLIPKRPGDDPRPEGLRPSLRQRLVPGGRAALPGRRPLPVALPPPPPRRPRPGQRLTLPYGRPAPARTRGTRPFPPDDPSDGDNFEARVKALLRRHVVERCIYGVDINPLAVEFARVSLWIETLDPDCRSRSSTTRSRSATRWSAAGWTGCRTTRSRRGSGRAATARTARAPQRIETFLKGEKVGNRRSGDGRDQAGDAGGHREPVPGLAAAVPRR